jgi:hypothetical protein
MEKDDRNNSSCNAKVEAILFGANNDNNIK